MQKMKPLVLPPACILPGAPWNMTDFHDIHLIRVTPISRMMHFPRPVALACSGPPAFVENLSDQQSGYNGRMASSCALPTNQPLMITCESGSSLPKNDNGVESHVSFPGEEHLNSKEDLQAFQKSAAVHGIAVRSSAASTEFTTSSKQNFMAHVSSLNVACAEFKPRSLELKQTDNDEPNPSTDAEGPNVCLKTFQPEAENSVAVEAVRDRQVFDDYFPLITSSVCSKNVTMVSAWTQTEVMKQEMVTPLMLQASTSTENLVQMLDKNTNTDPTDVTDSAQGEMFTVQHLAALEEELSSFANPLCYSSPRSLSRNEEETSSNRAIDLLVREGSLCDSGNCSEKTSGSSSKATPVKRIATPNSKDRKERNSSSSFDSKSVKGLCVSWAGRSESPKAFDSTVGDMLQVSEDASRLVSGSNSSDENSPASNTVSGGEVGNYLIETIKNQLVAYNPALFGNPQLLESLAVQQFYLMQQQEQMWLNQYMQLMSLQQQQQHLQPYSAPLLQQAIMPQQFNPLSQLLLQSMAEPLLSQQQLLLQQPMVLPQQLIPLQQLMLPQELEHQAVLAQQMTDHMKTSSMQQQLEDTSHCKRMSRSQADIKDQAVAKSKHVTRKSNKSTEISKQATSQKKFQSLEDICLSGIYSGSAGLQNSPSSLLQNNLQKTVENKDSCNYDKHGHLFPVELGASNSSKPLNIFVEKPSALNGATPKTISLVESPLPFVSEETLFVTGGSSATVSQNKTSFRPSFTWPSKYMTSDTNPQLNIVDNTPKYVCPQNKLTKDMEFINKINVENFGQSSLFISDSDLTLQAKPKINLCSTLTKEGKPKLPETADTLSNASINPISCRRGIGRGVGKQMQTTSDIISKDLSVKKLDSLQSHGNVLAAFEQAGAKFEKKLINTEVAECDYLLLETQQQGLYAGLGLDCDRVKETSEAKPEAHQGLWMKANHRFGSFSSKLPQEDWSAAVDGSPWSKIHPLWPCKDQSDA